MVCLGMHGSRAATFSTSDADGRAAGATLLPSPSKMSAAFTLKTLRQWAAKGWLAVTSAIVYLVSQVVIAAQLEHLGALRVFELQVTGFRAADYLQAFSAWQKQGVMPFYRSHLIFDDIHWIWYSVMLTSLMALAMNAADSPPKRNPLLLLPLVAGLCDALENGLQKVFLSDPTFATVVDPLPLLSTIASIVKWSLVALSLLTIPATWLAARRRRAS